MMKRLYSAFTLKDAALLISARQFTPWPLDIPPRPPSDFLTEDLRRLKAFDLETTESAKTLLIDALFAEIVPNYERLKVWKAILLETDSLTGVADYLIAPHYVYLTTPLLCVAEAKRDDFVQGRAQCLAEMYACAWNNQQEGYTLAVFGIVSNGQVWQFYQLTPAGEVFESGLFTTERLPELLGVLDFVCAECAKNVPDAAEASPARRAQERSDAGGDPTG
jgi:hypothetical protein